MVNCSRCQKQLEKGKQALRSSTEIICMDCHTEDFNKFLADQEKFMSGVPDTLPSDKDFEQKWTEMALLAKRHKVWIETTIE